MNDVDRERLGKVLQGRIGVGEFEAILQRAIASELGKLRAKVKQNSTGKEINHVRSI